MSARGLLPIALAVGFGIANGYVTFNPAFQELEVEKIKKQRAKAETDLGPNLVEIPAGKLEVDGENNATQEKGTSLSKASNLQSPTTESKFRWWPF